MTQKSEASEDPRAYRTRKLLQQAFIELTVEKGFAALTVHDITQRAMMNRSTFYRHYVDKYDLLEQYMDELYALFQDCEGMAELHPHETPSNLIDMLKHLQQFADFYRAMLEAKVDPFFEQRIRQKAEKRFFSYFKRAFSDGEGNPNTPSLDWEYNVTAAAGCGAVTYWLEQGQSYSPEHMAQWLNQFMYDRTISFRNLKG